MIETDRKEVTAIVVQHDDTKALGYIEGIQAAVRAIKPVIHAGIVNREAPAYFTALDDVVKELHKLLAAKSRG